jgi:hypothetical protein
LNHPALTPYAAWLASELPAPLAQLDDAATAHGRHFRVDERPRTARDYETQIAHTGIIPCRADNLHDRWNALVWLAWPALKTALNRQHLAAMRQETGPRGPWRDALTLLDESGILVFTREPALIEHLRNHAWSELFVTHREDVQRKMRFWVIGHGLLERLHQPYPGLTGKCLCLTGLPDSVQDADRLAADRILASPLTGRELSPLPLFGVPGWHADNADPGFYLDRTVFRPRPSNRHDPAVTA